MAKSSAILKSTVGAFLVKTSMPTGKDIIIEWNEKNGFQAEVPILLTYVDGFGKTKIHKDNWAQELLNKHDFLELVEIKEPKEVIKPVVVEPEVKARKERKKKDETNS